MTAVPLGRRLTQDASGLSALANPLGRIWYVDSVHGADGKTGDSPLYPLQTLARAIALAEAGDTIVLAPGGSETVTATLAVAVANLKILCTAKNPAARYSISGAGTLALMTISAANAHVEGLRFAHTGTTSSAAKILTTAAADGLHVERCTFDDGAIVTNFTGFGVSVVDDCNDVAVKDCAFLDCYRGVLFSIATGKNCARPRIEGCTFVVGKSAAFGVHASPAGSGTVRGLIVSACRFVEANGDGTAATTAWDGTDGTNATQGPILFGATVDQYVIHDCRVSSASAARFELLNAINTGAVGGKNLDQAAVGTEFWVKKTLVSSAIVQAGVDVTEVSVLGELSIEDVIVKTDGTGLAAGTNLEIKTNNAKGLANFFVTAVSGLGANKTIDLTNASVTKIKTVLETGKKVTADMTAADGTGAGTVDVYLKFRRLTAGASVAAA